MSLINTELKKKNEQEDIYVLGIRDGHNAGAALIKNGSVMAAISEERLTNIKNAFGVPFFSIPKVFEIAKVNPQSLSQVAVASFIDITPNPKNVDQNFVFNLSKYVSPYFHDKNFNKFAIQILRKMSPRKGIFQALERLRIHTKPITFIEHHLAHAASAFYQRPWKEKTLIFTLDGMGDGISSTVSIGENEKIIRIGESTHYDSIAGNLYSEVCSFLGFSKSEHEYKVMGLAPYGDPNKTSEIFRKMFRVNPKNPLEFENLSGHYMTNLQKVYQKKLARKRFDDISAGVQQVFEELVSKWVVNAIKKTNIHTIATAGGAFLNVKTNKIISSLPEVEKAFYYPAADDTGLPVGAALAGYIEFCKNNKTIPSIKPMDNLYYGQEFSEDYILDKLKSSRKRYIRVSEFDIAKQLSKGKIIARFSGRDEWGPRALGNRSIMADPRSSDIINKINFTIKHRDFWMPFAPSILEDDQEVYIQKSKFAPYMIEAFDTTTYAKKIVAGIHPRDLTARVQTVNNWNPGWKKIIQAFKKITGIGAILNTSFNLHGFPIASSPEQALWTFDNSHLDGVLFDHLLVLKN